MKLDWNKKYTTIAVYAFLVIAASAVFIGCLFNIGLVLSVIKRILLILNPIIYGFVIAFILNPLEKFFDRTVFAFVEKKKPRKGLRRGLSITCAYIVAIGIVSGFILIVVPQIISSFDTLQQSIVGYIDGIKEGITRLFSPNVKHNAFMTWVVKTFDSTKITSFLNNFISDSYKYVSIALPYVTSFLTSLVGVLKDALIAIIVSIYFLISRDKLCGQVKKLLYSILKKDRVEQAIDVTRMTSKTFEGFISGKIIDCIVIGIITYIAMAIAGVPYAPLVAVLIGITNFVPFFGPIVGAVIAGFLVFIVDPYKLVIYIILVVIIQQVDGNIIGPKILGGKVGLSALWIVVSLIFMSGIIGITGMFIGVPVFAVLYALIGNGVNKRLKKKEMSTDTNDYIRDPATEPVEKHLTDFEQKSISRWQKIKNKLSDKKDKKK